MKKTHTIGLLTAIAITSIGILVSSHPIFATSAKENLLPIQQNEGQTPSEKTPVSTVSKSGTEASIDGEWIHEDCHSWMNTEAGRAWHESMHDNESEHHKWMESEEGQQHHRGRTGDDSGRGSRHRRCH